MPRQIELQGSDRNIAVINGVKVRPGTCVLTGAWRTHPIHWAPARITTVHHRLRAVADAEAGHAGALYGLLGQIRDIDVQQTHRLQRRRDESFHQFASHAPCRFKVALGLTIMDQGDGDTRQA